jgi:mono/diheme cytochrome c family protein
LVRLVTARIRAKNTNIKATPGLSLMPNIFRLSLFVGALVVASAALAQDRAKIQAGAELYETRCAMCHGERLRATGGAFDLLKLRPNERARFDQAVNDGKGQMPAWGGVLSPDEIDQLWAYLRSRADS